MTKKQRTRNEKLANEIRQWLLDHEMWIDTTIYFNGKAYTQRDPETGRYYYNDPEHLFVENDMNPFDYFEYANPETGSMSFEGPLYEILNGYFGEVGWELEEEFNDLFRKYGMYFELGYSWSLTAVEV